AMRRWRDLLGDGVPPEATPLAWVGRMPDSPDGPGDPPTATVAILGFVWVGDPENGRRWLISHVASLGLPLAEQVEEVTYLGLQRKNEGRHPPGRRRGYYKGHYLRGLPDCAIDAFLSQGEPDPEADQPLFLNGS